MPDLPFIDRRARRSRYIPAFVIATVLLILAGAVHFGREMLRTSIRDQIAGRDAEVLYAVALTQLQDLPDEFTDHFTAVLETSKLRGVLGVRFFDAQGKYQYPVRALMTNDLPAEDVARLQQFRPLSKFHPAVVLADYILTADLAAMTATDKQPLLEISIPLHGPDDTAPTGFAQFLIEGHSIAAEFALLDRRLNAQAMTVYGASGALLLAVLVWAFSRMQRTNRLLAERTANLLQANQELALTARTVAVGAVTAHLIHGLKNPLSGLRHFMANQTTGEATGSDSDWFDAISTARRMQDLIHDVVHVLRDEETAVHYEITLPELLESLALRVRVGAQNAGVKLEINAGSAPAVFDNRVANLLLLILANLLQNAIEATPAGKTVRLNAITNGDVVFEVSDQGSGVPEAVRQSLFVPCPSTKDGGSGIGLAISKQLANHLQASLELKESSPSGCTFVLKLDRSRSTVG